MGLGSDWLGSLLEVLDLLWLTVFCPPREPAWLWFTPLVVTLAVVRRRHATTSCSWDSHLGGVATGLWGSCGGVG